MSLALGLIRPEWGATAWPILGQISAYTIDYWGRDAVLEVSERTLAKRTGLNPTTVGDRLERLVAQGVLEVFERAGRQARPLRIEGNFARWSVPWRIDRSKALAVLADAVVPHPIGGPQRWVCDPSYGGSQTPEGGGPDLPVYRIDGDFVPGLWTTHKPGVVSPLRAGSQTAPPVHAYRSTSYFSSLEEEEGTPSEAAGEVLEAIFEVTGQRLWGDPRRDVVVGMGELGDAGPVVAALRRERPTRWKDAIALAVRAAAAARAQAARDEEAERARARAEAERAEAERARAAGPSPSERIRQIRGALGHNGADLEEGDAL